MIQRLFLTVFALCCFLGLASPAIAGGETDGTDTTYLAWIREHLGTNTSGKLPETPVKNLLVYPGETIDHQEEIERALAGTHILVVILPDELQERVYPRVYAGWILAREYNFDAVAVLSGEQGGFESRFGWSQCHDVLNKTGVTLIGESTLRAVPGLKKCLRETMPATWPQARKDLLTAESQDAERNEGVFVLPNTKTEASAPEKNNQDSIVSPGIFNSIFIGIISIVFYVLGMKMGRKKARS